MRRLLLEREFCMSVRGNCLSPLWLGIYCGKEMRKVMHYVVFLLCVIELKLFPEITTQFWTIIICFSMRKCGQCCCPHDNTVLVEDNCCECNYAAMRKLGQFKNTDMIYVTYHVDVSKWSELCTMYITKHNSKNIKKTGAIYAVSADHCSNFLLFVTTSRCVACSKLFYGHISGLTHISQPSPWFQIGETPFFVAVDHEQKTVVISIRGTLSLQVIMHSYMYNVSVIMRCFCREKNM